MVVRLFVAAMGLWLFSGCTLQGAVRQDTRVEILHPEDSAHVEVPLELDWTVEDFEITEPDGSASNDRGYFGLFLDRPPMRPGEDLASLAEDDPQCQRTPGCPGRAWFERNNVFLTTETSYRFQNLPDTRPEENLDAPDRHEIIIVLLNGKDFRIGETSFSVDFTVNRD